MAVPRSRSSWWSASVSLTVASILTVTLDTTAVKRYTPRPVLILLKGRRRTCDERREAGRPRSSSRSRALLPPTRSSRLWRSRRPRRADGTRAGRRQEVADEGRDARGHRGLSVLARTARHPGRHLDFLHTGRVLGSLGG